MTLILSGTDGLSDIDGSASTPAIRGTDANTGIFFPAADTIAFAEGGAEVARFDSSGQLGLGTSSPTARLTVVTGSPGNNEGEIRISENATYYAGMRRVNATDEFRIGSYGASQNITFYTVSSERARIDSSGNMLVGKTSTSSTATGVIAYGTGAADHGMISVARGSNATMIEFRTTASGNVVGQISQNGTNTTYSTSSDYRLKENIQPITGALAKVAALKPVIYKWKADGSDGEGFIAHELAEVVPQCVTGEKDAVDEDGTPKYQGIDTSFLVATLTAAIKEQQQMIETLQAKVAALEAKG